MTLQKYLRSLRPGAVLIRLSDGHRFYTMEQDHYRHIRKMNLFDSRNGTVVDYCKIFYPDFTMHNIHQNFRVFE